ncbi:MAG: hypothetical protein ACXACI_13085 [Candidatus Hodarchaeales archaeon]|jgi:hypothetical protein
MNPKSRTPKTHFTKARGKGKVTSTPKGRSRRRARYHLSSRKAPKPRVSRIRRAVKRSKKKVSRIHRHIYPVPGAPRYD